MEKMMESDERLKKFGERLRKLRNILGFSQRELAVKVNTTHVSINRLENGTKVGSRILLGVLSFYSQYVSIDVLFDEKAWTIALQDQEMLIKKTHINSIIHAKLTLMKKHLIDEMKRVRQVQAEMDQEFEGYIRRGMDGAISMLDEE